MMVVRVHGFDDYAASSFHSNASCLTAYVNVRPL